MNHVSFDIKTLMSIIAATAVLGGFYYTTQHRLDHLELKIEELETEIAKVKKIANRKSKR